MPAPLYRKDGIQIFNIDCLKAIEKIPNGVALISDPPYGIGNNCSYAARGLGRLMQAKDYPNIINDDKPFDPSPFLRFNIVALFGANYYSDKLPLGTWHVWDKTRYGTHFSDQSDCEFIWTNIKSGNRVFHHLWKGMLKDSERHLTRVHPTQKPVAVFHWLIETLRIPQEFTLVDPFMGSGSSLLAARQLGIKAIGMEISEDYCKVAINRLEKGE